MKRLKRAVFWLLVIATIVFGLVITGVHVRILAPSIVKRFANPNGTAFKYNSPTIVDDCLYIGTSNWVDFHNADRTLSSVKQNYIYKMDLDLHAIWRYELDKQEICAGAVALDSQDNLYFVIQEYCDGAAVDRTAGKFDSIGIRNYLCSLTHDGQLRWKRQISSGASANGMLNPAISRDDRIYVASSKFHAFSNAGDILWQYPGDSRVLIGCLSSPIIDRAGNVYFVSPEPDAYGNESDNIEAYKFAPDCSGTPLWKTSLDNPVSVTSNGVGGGYKTRTVMSSPSFASCETVLVASAGTTMNAIDTSTGRVIWSLQPQSATGTFNGSPAVDCSNNIYVGTKDNEGSVLYAFKADGSGLIWENPIGSDMYPSPLIGDDGILYIGSESSRNGVFHAVDLRTGQDHGSISNALLEDFSFGSPVLYKGYIYFGTHKQNSAGSLFKIKVQAYDYQAGAQWPRFRGGNSSSGRSD